VRISQAAYNRKRRKKLMGILQTDVFWIGLGAIVSATMAVATFRLASITKAALHQSARATTLESIRERRVARPILIAIAEPMRAPNYRSVSIRNKGSTAFYVSVAGRSSENEPSGSAENFFQVISPGESVPTKITIVGPGAKYAQKIRIRYYDAYGEKYITEYRSLGESLAYPIFRVPWLGREIGDAKPKRWSDEVSWEVEHFERTLGVPQESLDPKPPGLTEAEF